MAFDPLKPSVSETALVCKLYTVISLVALEPSVTLPNAKLGGKTVIVIVPLPLSATLCGLVAVLSLSVSVARRAPRSRGVKPIAMVQVRPGASPLPSDGQVEVPTANSAGSDEVTLPMNSGLVLPVLLTTSFMVAVSPCGEPGKLSESGTEMEVGGCADAANCACDTVGAVAAIMANAAAPKIAIVPSLAFPETLFIFPR